MPAVHRSSSTQGVSPFYAAIRAAERAMNELNYAKAMQLLDPIYSSDPENAPLEGLSCYGRCLVVKEKLTALGVSLCRRAIRGQSYDARHYVNLARSFLFLQDRKSALNVVDEGLKRLPKDASLLEIRGELGWRQAPVLRFLDRSNPLNVAAGRLRASPPAMKVLRLGTAVSFLLLTFIGTFVMLSKL